MEAISVVGHIYWMIRMMQDKINSISIGLSRSEWQGSGGSAGNVDSTDPCCSALLII